MCRTTRFRRVLRLPSVTRRLDTLLQSLSEPPASSSAQCLEGDVYIEGELHGQLTVASAANIMVTRDLTDQCADGVGSRIVDGPFGSPGVHDLGHSRHPRAFGTVRRPHLREHREPAVDCSTNGYGDGTGTPTNTGTKIGGKSYPNDPKAVWPTLCNPQNVDIDAAVFALNGSFGVENWNTTPQSGNANFNGSDLSEYRGPFGIPAPTATTKEFSFDQRLAYAAPPNLLPAGVVLWQNDSYVLCSPPLSQNRLESLPGDRLNKA